jgi:hypothetical protein
VGVSATCCWVNAKSDGSVVGWLSGEYWATEVGVATGGCDALGFSTIERERDRCCGCCCGSDFVAMGG